ncbi:MAG TPA: adenylyltransferase/cytidyltransferase family protein, partial [Gammaproteobacteria bacterium]|nr:adenylyltransferase/cytidyltransferase family protein [Gammaproteobacteria bacterium]
MLGIFGGTFDPIHFGHLRPAVELQEALGLDEVRMVPCRLPPHRETPGAGAEHRLAMLRRGIDGVPGLVIDERELERPGP